MKNFRVVILGSIVCIALFTSCTKQELNDEEKLETEFKSVDKNKVADPSGR